MKHKLKSLCRDQQGSMMLLVALSIAAMLAVAGLVIDGGTVYVVKSQLQKTANAAALSGAQELTHSELAVRQVIETILLEHDEMSSLSEARIVMEQQVTVALQREVPLTLISIFSTDTLTVKVEATAALASMGRATGVAPLGIDEAIPLVFLQEYNLKVDEKDSDTGNFGILALGGGGAATYEDNLKYGYQNQIKLGDILDTQTGNVVDKTRTGVNERINSCPYPSGEYHHRDCPRVILIPVYQKYNYDSNQLKQVKVIGFAYFYILEPMSNQDKTIKGMFIKRTGTGFAEPDASATGAYAIRLIR
jgi:hypothetical protein